MRKRLQPPRPVVRAGARFHADQARGTLAKKPQPDCASTVSLASPCLAHQCHAPASHPLPDRSQSSISPLRPLLVTGASQISTLPRSMPLQKAATIPLETGDCCRRSSLPVSPGLNHWFSRWLSKAPRFHFSAAPCSVTLPMPESSVHMTINC